MLSISIASLSITAMHKRVNNKIQLGVFSYLPVVFSTPVRIVVTLIDRGSENPIDPGVVVFDSCLGNENR